MAIVVINQFTVSPLIIVFRGLLCSTKSEINIGNYSDEISKVNEISKIDVPVDIQVKKIILIMTE